MNSRLRALLANASHLSTPGRLQAATHAIHSALRSASLGGSAGLGAAGLPRQRFTAPAPPFAGTPDERFTTGSHRAAGLQRDYKLFVPSSHREGRLPMVVMLHGCKQNPDDFAAGTAINERAEAQGFYVLYPAQCDQANPQRCWNWFKHNHQSRGRGEPALIADLVRAIAARHPVDAERVYIAGLSAGGAMAAVCGAAYPDVFAAVGVHSGLAAGSAADLPSALAAMRSGPQQRPAGHASSGMPTIVFHGEADAVVHPANGDAIFERSVGPRADIQVERVHQGGLHCTRRFVCSAEGTVWAEHWRIQGAAHAWSGGSRSGSYTDSRGPSATAEMLRFFGAHRRMAHE